MAVIDNRLVGQMVIFERLAVAGDTVRVVVSHADGEWQEEVVPARPEDCFFEHDRGFVIEGSLTTFTVRKNVFDVRVDDPVRYWLARRYGPLAFRDWLGAYVEVVVWRDKGLLIELPSPVIDRRK